MYLRRLELQGFKTFAQKTALEFMSEGSGRRGMTAVVGPNGSGKSNIADAIRWVMGEQSLKLLRGKKSEDVIFSGSEKKSRSGFAEVTMTLVNDEPEDADLPEIVITRRLYRDGQSEYEVNKQPARLTDVALLLAQAGVGQRTYSVIGQGMVDHILSASPAERKEFFEEAAGLKPFQLKRQASLNKLAATQENMKQAEIVLRELGPRLSSLERQVRKLKERDGMEVELRSLEREYYGQLWRDLRQAMRRVMDMKRAAETEQAKRAADVAKLDADLAALEKATPPSEGFREIRQAIEALSEERSKLRERQFRLEASREVAKVRAEKPWSPLPLSKIIEAIEHLLAKQDELVAFLSAANHDQTKVSASFVELRAATSDLLSKLQRPAPEPTKEPEFDPTLERDLKQIAHEMASLEEKTHESQRRLEDWNKQEEGKRAHIFTLQHELTRARQAEQQAERQVNNAAIEVARLEARRDGILQDLRSHAPALEAELERLADAFKGEASLDNFMGRISRLRTQLEWVGGIDPAVLSEYEETKKRFDDLSAQTQDLHGALNTLKGVIAELDATIKERARMAFHSLDKEFGQFFKKLFGGGEARLVEVAPEPVASDATDEIEKATLNVADSSSEVAFNATDATDVAGIDIQATPPGKRLKAIALLSGGERALTSIALICAIMATNPSPFVVLDEVDAALDESNSRKFAEILALLADKTQFIVVSHNRATINQAHVLYGVTMGEDGVSQLLSVKLEEN